MVYLSLLGGIGGWSSGLLEMGSHYEEMVIGVWGGPCKASLGGGRALVWGVVTGAPLASNCATHHRDSLQ